MLAAVVSVALVVYLIHFLARGISRRVGERTGNRSLEGNRPPLIRPGFALSLFLILLGWYFLSHLPTWWPPQWLQRSQQRREVLRRIELAGGWERLTAEATMFAATNDLATERFVRFSTNANLPPSFAILKPYYIEANPGQTTNTLLFSIFFGGRRGSSYALFVVAGRPQTEAVEVLRAGVAGASTIRQIANGVYEVY
jgi:hypothetical protein